ncbi:MAG: ATP-binding cassette domain-containing protein [Methanomassiliicoccales archaeon]|jgi:ABC-2 type transport system ATP-binding protein
MSIVETHSLTKQFGKFVAVDNLSFNIEKGEIFGLLGPNGAGKTTTIKMLVTLLPPSSGSAEVAGYQIGKEAKRIREVIGYIPQMLSAEGSLTGYENLLIFSKLYGIPRREREDRIRRALSLMGLSEAADRLVRTYSGGMIRRLETAQAALHRPAVMFMDEPTVGLDPVARRAVWNLIEELRSEFDATILLTTHIMEEAEILCDRVAIMHRGKLAAIGRPEDLIKEVGVSNLDEVFIHYAGETIEVAGSFKEVQRERKTARRLG